MIIVFDGHDASGKTTLSRCLSEALNAPLVKPFAGTVGQEIKRLTAEKRFKELEEYAKDILLNFEKKFHDEKYIVFDRHWLTILTLLPNYEFKTNFITPKTFVCHSDLDTTIKRLNERKDGKENEWDHEYYINLYKELGVKYNCVIIDTTPNPDPKDIIDNLIKQHLEV